MTEIGPDWRIAKAEKVRAAMGPEMTAVADALRLAFDAKIVWFDTPSLQMGQKPDDGVCTQWHGERRRA